MQLHEFRAFADHHGRATIRTYLDVSEATFRRWYDGSSRIPHAAAIAMLLHFVGDLSALGGDGWENFRLAGGLLFIPGWKYGWTPDEVRALFFTKQGFEAARRDVARLESELQAAKLETERERLRADGYKRALLRPRPPRPTQTPRLYLVATTPPPSFAHPLGARSPKH